MAHQNNIELISTLNDCIAECLHCATACSEEKDASMLSKCIKTDFDCTEICRTAVSFLCRGSDYTYQLLQECARICQACATECEKHSDMDHCKKCAEVCRKCAQECIEASEEAMRVE